MKGFSRHITSLAGFVPGWAVILLGSATLVSAVELYTSDTEEPEPRRSEITLNYGKVSINDTASEAQIQEDLGIQEGDTGGLESFYWENDPEGDWKSYLEGSILSNPDRVKVAYELHNGETVFFDLGFLHWKEFDFGSGIYYPTTNTFAVLSADALVEEINKLDLSLRIHVSDLYRVELSYGFFNRTGQSLSTRFGDDNQFRVGGARSRGIIPSMMDGDETVHTFDMKVVRQDEVDLTGVRVHFQRREVDRSRSVERGAQQASANRYTTQKEDSSDDLFAASGFARRELGDHLVGSLGFAFTRLDGDITGSRIFGSSPEAAFDIDFPALQFDDRSFLDLESTRKLKQWIFNANLVYSPNENMRWLTGVRLEQLSTEAFSSYIDVYSTVDWSVQQLQVQESAMLADSDKNALDISGFLEGRYTGFKRMLLYSRVQVSNQEGDLDESWSSQRLAPTAGSVVDLLSRVSDFERMTTFWETGVNYFPKAGLRFSLEGYLKYRENSYNWAEITRPEEDYTLYPGYIRNQTLDTRDVNGRIHYRIFESLNSVTRVDFQQTTIETESFYGSSIQSSERERFVFNQSLTWTPSSRFFMSGSFNYVEDLTETGAADLEGTFSGIVVNLPNDYWQVDLNVFYVLSKLIDIQLGYQYMEMTNYLNTAPKTVPYGSDFKEHHGSARLVFHVSERTRARIGYDYYEREEPSSNGFRDYTVHLVTGSYQIVF